MDEDLPQRWASFFYLFIYFAPTAPSLSAAHVLLTQILTDHDAGRSSPQIEAKGLSSFAKHGKKTQNCCGFANFI